MNDPQTAAEWQDAVDAATGALALESARQYGFVTGGPTVHVERCEEILEAGKARGFKPHAAAVERFVADVQRSHRSDA